ncbi:c-type cytochrome [Hydrogenophaga sp.]|uniref:c-type cytochrome n=1 Tax=Hydrogenophaga sp. TaxID=1904254 RepID=UPI003AF7A029
MKTILLLSALATVLPAGTALADDEFYKTKNCFACHRIDRNTLGPSFKSVAAKYADDTSADVMLAKKIREGSVGVWGQVPMPPQSQVSEDESLTLARWILGLK